MQINATLIGQAIAFLILILVSWKFIWPILTTAIDQRQKKIADGLAAAERGQKDLGEAQARADALIREARERAMQIVDAASRRSNELVETAKGTATEEGDRLIASAKQQIELESTRAREDLRREVARLTVASASKLLGREIDAAKHADILGKLAAEI